MVALAGNVKVLCAVGDFENRTFNLPQKLNRSTIVQLTTIAPIAQNTCYAYVWRLFSTDLNLKTKQKK